MATPVTSPIQQAPDSAKSGRVVRYLAGRMTRWQRLLVGLVGVALLPVMFVPVLPIWRIFLVAPQYREGLKMLIFVNDVQGDLRNINILNHYIGMQHIDASNFPEFGYMPMVLTLFGVVALIAAVSGRRWLALIGWLGFAGFGTVMMLHFASWLSDYGTNLDPKAALDFGAFTPPLFGTAKRGNFVITSFPHFGGYILFAAGLLGPLLAGFDLLKHWRGRTAATAVLVAGLAWAGSAGADDFVSYAAPPEPNPLQELVSGAAPGDTLRLPDGVHVGQLVIDRTLVVLGSPDCVIDGDGNGSVVIVRGQGTVLRGFTVRNSGYELLFDDSGVLIDEADDVRLESMHLVDNNHGIYVRNALRPHIVNCELTGRRGRVHEENHGNGIHVWHAKDAEIAGNTVRAHRDGIYLSFAETAIVDDNLLHDQDRFGLHSMYSQRNILERNTLTRNTAGVALMFSNRMTMTGNLFIHNRGHRTYGLLLRDCSDSDFRGNRLVDNTIGVFLDGSNRNRFTDNILAENGWGLIAYSSSDNNTFTGNAFLNNDYQVSLDMRRTSNRFSVDGTGNFWSDARPYDLDGDGVGDAPHHPVSLFAFVSKQFPDLTVFAGSPAVLALDLAQRSLPALQPTDLYDAHPLLAPLILPAHAGPAVPSGRTEQGSRIPLAATAFGLALTGAGAMWRAR